MLRVVKYPSRYEVDLTPFEFKDASSGIRVTATHKGIEVFGWYDTYVGISESKLIPWEDIDKARELSNVVFEAEDEKLEKGAKGNA